MVRFVALLAVLILSFACTTAMANEEVLQDVSVSPRFALSNEAVTIRATVLNTLSYPLTNVSAVVSTAGDVRTEVLVPSETVPILGPGTSVSLKVVVEIQASGIPKIGAVIKTDQGLFPPKGQRVFLRDGSVSGQSFVILALIFSCLSIAGFKLLKWTSSGREERQGKQTLIFAIGLVLLVIGWLAFLQLQGVWVDAGIVALFLLLWFGFVRAITKRSPLADVATCAILLFLVIGMGWSLFEQIGIWNQPINSRLAVEGVQSTVTWPLGLGQLIWFLTGRDL